jgi:hypothetical protein
MGGDVEINRGEVRNQACSGIFTIHCQLTIISISPLLHSVYDILPEKACLVHGHWDAARVTGSTRRLKMRQSDRRGLRSRRRG